ncbi:hypothetical protein E4U42_007557, partial [Claviceps africana]
MSTLALSSRTATQICRRSCLGLGHAATLSSRRTSRSGGSMKMNRVGCTERHRPGEARERPGDDQRHVTAASAAKASVARAVIHEDIYTIPNLLTLTRLVAAPAVGYLVLHDSHAWAVGLFAYAGITDLLDGWIARRWNRKTVVGTIIDPLADKALMTILTVCLATKGALP